MSRKVARNVATALFAAILVAGVAGPAVADDNPDADHGQGDPGTVVIDGRTFGPEDGVQVTEEWLPLPEPGSGETVGVEWGTTPPSGTITPMVYWGTSYAYSVETAFVWYSGYAKAAANVYQGERIIQVCIQFQRGGKGIADQRCSTASSNGSSWSAGAEAVSYATDSLGLNDPQTVMYIKTTRINPGII
ncbi:hypothetical protein SK224_01400 [Microbacterium sp. BG28]|uniref:hypothetical protein n=1 Tax=Microbacterium sp. BG28 TaxID=3097356 RepID=UPI002A5A932E|nr:hypothetical protein [Microbacterium sp. BG28]MDY0827773.1 hypothetical protein [Microbacterium sp. BG28]